MSMLEERYERGRAIKALMAGDNPSHFTSPGIDQLASDLKRIIDEALYGSVWARPGLDIKYRCICALSALMALGYLPLLRRHIERALNVGLAPAQIVEVFIQLTFYVGVPAVEAALRMAKEIFEERGIEFIPTQVYDTSKSVDELHEIGARTHEEHIDDITAYDTEDPDSQEMQLERLINEYHWGAIHTRPHLDRKALAICALSSITLLGHYDQQIRRPIEGALRVGMTPEEIMEVFIQLTLYGGYFNTRTIMRIARSVFTEQGLSEKEGRETNDRAMSGEAS
jgi:4-carboxymuconolactone decarboxylase